MLVENKLMWPPCCFRWDIDEKLRGPLDALIHAVYTGSAVNIFVPPETKSVLVEKEPIRFYDSNSKERIRDEVWPVLQSAFVSGSDKPWEIDDKGSLLFIWSDLEEFFVNLLWCSQLKMSFVFDLDRLRNAMTAIRDRLVKERKLSDPRLLNALLAIMSLYDRNYVGCFMPRESGRGTAIEIWRQLKSEGNFLEVSRETRKLGFMRESKISEHLFRIKQLVTRGAANPALAGTVSIGKTGVSVLLGPAGKIGTEIGSRFISQIVKSPYVPPIYLITEIEESFERLFYPERTDENG